MLCPSLRGCEKKWGMAHCPAHCHPSAARLGGLGEEAGGGGNIAWHEVLTWQSSSTSTRSCSPRTPPSTTATHTHTRTRTQWNHELSWRGALRTCQIGNDILHCCKRNDSSLFSLQLLLCYLQHEHLSLKIGLMKNISTCFHDQTYLQNLG